MQNEGIVKQANIKKQIFIITILIFVLTIALYEFFYCNYEYFIGGIKTYNFSIYRIIMYIIIFLLYYKFKDLFIDEAVKAMNNKVKKYAIFIAMFISILSLIFYIAIIQSFTLNFVILLIAIINFNLFAIYISNDIYKNVIVIALTFGTIFSISITFNNQLDEKIHFMSSYSVALGSPSMNNAKIDQSLAKMPRQMDVKTFIKFFNEKPSNEITKEFEELDIKDKPCVYNTLSYFISGLGIFIAKTLGGSVADIYITGRIFNLIGYIVLIIMVLKTLPYKHKIFYSVFFMPMLLALSAIYSPDGIVVGICSLFVAYCFKLKEQEGKIGTKELVILLILTLLVCMVKSIGYIGILMALFILPLKNIYQQNKKFFHYAFIFALLMLVIVAFEIYTSINAPGDPRVNDTNTIVQFKQVVQNPLRYIAILIQHFYKTFTNTLGMSFINAPMFFRKTYYINYLLISIYLLAISFTDSSKHLKIKERILFLLSFLIVFATISTAMYLSYTPVGANYIGGYQMRYIFPTMSLILISLSTRKTTLKEFSNNSMYINYPIAIFLITSIIDTLL